MLQRVVQRLDAMEKSSHTAAGSDNRSATPISRFSRLDSGAMARVDSLGREGHNIMRAQHQLQQQQLLEADHNYQVSLAHARQEFEMRNQDLFGSMEAAFLTFTDFFRLAMALSDVYQRAKADLFTSAIGCQMLLLTTKANDTTRLQLALEQAEKARNAALARSSEARLLC
eukprot:CAMPEP_0176417990 /NCGR_PEP_ID=MMETSP0127-20121128/7202_1 /TAXON_ID=938130 /ORGANISM="Platyophrya macrostoma, Strain WH" /LENGTH=170 /DNA_ID=CAMNT_0017798225 /DNA_START=15 /DNA_END=527 /DNA_ORIENTATION=+